MAKIKMSDVRNFMIEGMERLLDEDDKFGHKESNALSGLGKAIVETAKAEIMAAKLAGAKYLSSNFIEIEQPPIMQIAERQPHIEPYKQLTPKQIDKLG